MEIILTNVSESILIYVSKDFNIKIKNDNYNIINIELKDYNSSGDILERYVDDELLHNQSTKYRTINVDNLKTNRDFEDKTEQLYNRPLTTNKKEFDLITSYRQIYRLGQIVRHSYYKVSLLSKGYLYVVNRDNNIDIYKNINNTDLNLQLYPLLRLENLY